MNARRLFGFSTSLTLHLLAAASIAWLTSAPARPVSRGAQMPNQMVVVAPQPDTVRLPEGDVPIPRGAGASDLRIGGFTFNFTKVADRATALFPFFTRPLPLERVAPRLRRADAGALVTPFAPPRVSAARPPLVLSDRALQLLVDKSWSRRDRWRAFQPIAAIVGAHRPNDGRVLALLRAYLDQNLLQPYVDTTIPDPRLWTMLGIAADHTDFMDFIGRYASQHPSTKVTTELLFLLEELAQASLDAFHTLLDTKVQDLWWTRETNRDAYDLIVAIQQHYRGQLRKKDVPREVLSDYYDDVRLRILTNIVRTTPDGYRVSDALFLSGVIYWKQGRADDAVRVWREMTFDAEDSYATAYSEILAALHASDSVNRSEIDTAHINRILAAEHRRWLALSARRLRQFGYDFDVF